MAKYLFVCYPRCSTCQKARKWLEAKEIDFEERDITVKNPTAAELDTWQTRSGLELKRFFNTSGMLYREQGLKDKLPDMDRQAQLDLLATNGMLVKRPLLIGDKMVLAGFREAEWETKIK